MQWLKQKFKEKIALIPGVAFFVKAKRLKAQLTNQQRQTHLAIERIYAMHLKQLVHEKNYGVDDRQEIDVIVSLTSYGKRLSQVQHTVLSLLVQSVKVKKIVLWVAETDMPLVDANQALVELTKYDFEIKAFKDIRSYKKLIPSLIAYSNDTIITFDDDVIYPDNLVEKLYHEHLAYPDCVIAGRAHKIKFNEGGRPQNYVDWSFDSQDVKPCVDLVAIGVGGVLYPPGCFDSEVKNEHAFTSLAPTCDDLWFKIMSCKVKTKVKVISTPTPYNDYLHLPALEESLWQRNIVNNDIQLNNLLNKYSDALFQET